MPPSGASAPMPQKAPSSAMIPPMLNVHSMKFRLMAMGAILVLLGLASRLFVAMPLIQAQIQELVSAQQLSIATYIARDVDLSITTRLETISQLARDLPPDLVQHPAHLQTWVRERQRINPIFNSGLMVVSPDGKGLLGEYPAAPGRNSLDYAASDWFLAAQQANSAVLS